MRLAGRGAAAIFAAVAISATGASAAQAHQIAGVVPDLGGHASLWHATMASAGGVANPYGGPVLHANRTHLIFWAPAGSGLSFDPGYATLMERFLNDVAADSRKTSNVYSLSGQYYDSRGPAAYDSAYVGAVTATDSLPADDCTEPSSGPVGWAHCLTDRDLQDEIDHVVTADNLPQGADDIYFLILPNGLGTCTDSTSTICALGGSQTGFCGYHSQTSGLDVLYAVIPYNAVPGHCQSGNPRPNGSTADPAISTLSHEHIETVTDPEPYASWIDSSGDEIGDLCITSFGRTLGGSGSHAWNEVVGRGHFYLQEEWSNASGGCEPRAPADRISFTVPSHPKAGAMIKIAAHVRAPQGRIVGYLWTFGDGNYGHQRVTGPTFKSAGTYRVGLRATDSWGNWAQATRLVKIFPASGRGAPSHHTRVTQG